MTMEEDRLEIEKAIRRKIKAANRAAKTKNYEKISELYFDVSILFLEIGDEQNAKKFNKTAKKYQARVELQKIINKYISKARVEYEKGKFRNVAKIYFQVADVISKIDPDRGNKFRLAGQKILSSGKRKKALQLKKQRTIETKSYSSLKVNQQNNLDQIFVDLNLVCPNCGKDLDPEFDICPNCGTKVE
ncbi:MAG: zinc-ribbon domain-containing protein [Candidatus Lokiarchaeota archaeon]|nr:zinc-ribbon domain-containing protein [Candidatus Lokiarchaeota archaeon]